MEELKQAIKEADLDSVSLGSVIAYIVLEDYGEHNAELFLNGYHDILNKHNEEA